MEASAASRPVAARGAHVPVRLLRLASDERLVALVRTGSEPAFELLYDRHHRGILAFCRHMLGSREEAEDAVQHTFMAAYRALLQSDKEMQLRAWLYAIARNRCLSVLRARRERPVDEIDDIPTEGLAAQVERRQDLQDLLRDLAGLPEDQRAALVLSEIGDLPHEDIASVIGCSREKVKALVFQARSSLHSSRQARDTSCQEIRELLSSLRGGSLRRTELRRHLKECPGCREFQAEVKRQRQAMAVMLPVVPTAGLKTGVLSAAFGAKGATAASAAAAGSAAATALGTSAAATGTTVATTGAVALTAKVLVVAAAVGGGAAGIKSVADHTGSPSSPPASERGPGGGGQPPSAVNGAPVVTDSSDQGDAASEAARKLKKAKARRRGHTDRGKEFAKTRGKGHKRGLLGTQPGKTGTAGKSDDKPAKGNSTTERGKSETARERRKAKQEEAAARKEQKTAKATPTPRPTPTPRATGTPTPEPTPEPEVTAEPTPSPERGSQGGGKNAGE